MVEALIANRLTRTVATASIAFQRAYAGAHTREKGSVRNAHCRGSPSQWFLPGDGLLLRPVGTAAIVMTVSFVCPEF